MSPRNPSKWPNPSKPYESYVIRVWEGYFRYSGRIT
jgi:hypothetical protein